MRGGLEEWILNLSVVRLLALALFVWACFSPFLNLSMVKLNPTLFYMRACFSPFLNLSMVKS